MLILLLARKTHNECTRLLICCRTLKQSWSASKSKLEQKLSQTQTDHELELTRIKSLHDAAKADAAKKQTAATTLTAELQDKLRTANASIANLETNIREQVHYRRPQLDRGRPLVSDVFLCSAQSAALTEARVTASQQLQQQHGKHMQDIDTKAAVRIPL